MMGKRIAAELLGRALLTKTCLKGQWDGPGGKVACHQSWRFEFNPRNYLVEGQNQCLQVLPSVSCGMHSWLGVGIISLCKLRILKLGRKLSWGKEDHQLSVQRTFSVDSGTSPEEGNLRKSHSSCPRNSAVRMQEALTVSHPILWSSRDSLWARCVSLKYLV